MTDYATVDGLRVATCLKELIEDEMIPGSGVDGGAFWRELERIVDDLGPLNRALLDRRDRLQDRIDEWLITRRGRAVSAAEQAAFLSDIGYLEPEPGDFSIATAGVDPEVAERAGPQLVVPVDNARYALNAANARWGSLYDALYGTDVIPEDGGAERGAGYNPERGARVIDYAARFLDQAVPLVRGSHGEVHQYLVEDDSLPHRLYAILSDGQPTELADINQFAGFQRGGDVLEAVLLRHHGLHIELAIDRRHPIGRTHPAGLKDVILESALTTIEDCEDSVAAVDADDKTRVYRNWLGLMKGTLGAEFEKAGEVIKRRLSPDREYLDPHGQPLILPGRSLLLVRNVGPAMYTDAVTTAAGEPIPEGFLDAMVTALAACHDLNGNGKYRNSRSGSVYIVKPKQHGTDEVAATVELFARVEAALGLEPKTLKIGIMDEERRTTLNLKACIAAARERLIFINTGFLDRTGDEIHTGMEAGPVIPKAEIKSARWMLAYEDWNVDVGLAAGLSGRAQIGKGMWAMPDEMAAMVESKIEHPRAGASTAWVPSPTAATLHAMHYHRVDVAARQRELAGQRRAAVEDLLAMPLLGTRRLEPAAIERELEGNAQGILGYVVRWVEQGVGCSKVPDLADTGLMEDRATLRISSQHIANWLHHGLVDKQQVSATFEKMARVVDCQNAGDPAYRPMAHDFEQSHAFQAALELVFGGRESANGYTEETLHRWRRRFKASSRG